MNNWEDIASAPKKEFEEIILFNGKVLVAQWWEGHWVDSFSMLVLPLPTLWQPLPPSPSEE
jgi:hypothetical protein